MSDRVSSPSELSREMGVRLSDVAYHTKELLKLDCVEVVGKEPVRGSTKTSYRATTRMLLETDAWEQLSKETRAGISINALNEVIKRATAAIEGGSFDKRCDRTLITLKLSVGSQDWERVQRILYDAYERISEVEEEAANHPLTEEDAIRMTVSLLGYESPESPTHT